jgi:hypothetical protein
MRRLLFSKLIVAISLTPLSLCACSQATGKVGDAPQHGPTATPAAQARQVETGSSLSQSPVPKPPAAIDQKNDASHSNLLPGVASKEDQAQALLQQIREALGGEARLKEVQSFSASGPFRRVSDDQEQSGDIRVDMLLPDKFKQSETLSLIAGIEIVIVETLSGDQTWTDTQSGGGNAQVMMVRRKGSEQQMNTDQLKSLRGNFTRYLLSLFLTPPPNTSIEFVYGGEAEAKDGRADILDLKGDDGFSARLFIDKKTHRPLMISYRDVVVNMKTTKASGATIRDVDKIVKDAQAKPPARQESDIVLHFSEYRAENGILLPHLLSKTVNGQPFEEWKLTNFKINPPELTPQKFEKRK